MGWKWTTTLLLAVLAAAPLAAQSRGGEAPDSVPAEFRPPPGMCRIWIENVPPGRQPAPTDCATAVRNRPSNGRVLFGDDYVKRAAADSAAPQRHDRLSVPGEPRYRRDAGNDERDERFERGLTGDERKRGVKPAKPEKRKKPTG
ncbi:MAG TPA: hypothetical protein VNA89_14910 [Gemmatimonadaceae bacterium]|nr:hypothetical protein [Gemmatimonadaceae bacterium]